MSLRDFTRSVGPKIGVLGGAFMLDPTSIQRCTDAGLPFPASYALGRGGVLGDVSPDVVIANFHFFPELFAGNVWAQGRELMEPRPAAEMYAEVCRAWGRDHLGSVDGLDAFCAQAERVAAAADVAGLPLFAGWRSMPLPDDLPGRAAQMTHVLREFRGGCNGIATKVVGLKPLEAVMVNGGEGQARMFGWQDPLPDPEPLRDKAAKAEDITDDLVGPAFSVLTDDERKPFEATLDAMLKAAGLG